VLTVPPDTSDLLFGEVIGRGGTAVVVEAEQRSLARKVAVKQAHDGRDASSLYREALVVARLQHPSIVPVHQLDHDQDGRPRIVMTRVHGARWSSVIRAPGQFRSMLGDSDPLAFHLRVFIDLCHAVAYAHSEGVLHRDIKPANVMIGRFGQVYLLDWGLAVALRDHAQRVLPMAAEVRRVEGTPAYMAPEMARGDGSALDERTDVYLLGSTLHQVLTGRGRNEAEDTVGKLAAAFYGEPFSYGPDVPPELGRIANKACAPEPRDRYVEVMDMVADLRAYQEHRASAELSQRAIDELTALIPQLKGDELPVEQVARVRYALVHARQLWPENPSAERALQRLLRGLIEHHIRVGDAGAAAAILPHLPEASEELELLVSCAREAQRAMLEELQGHRHDVDPAVAARLRVRLFTGLSVAFLAVGSVAQACVALGMSAYPVFMVINVVMGITILPLSRRRANDVHARAADAARIRAAGTVLSFMVAWGLGLEFHVAVVFSLLITSFMLASAWVTLRGVVLDWTPFVALGLGIAVAALWPPLSPIVWGLALGAASLGQARANHRVVSSSSIANR